MAAATLTEQEQIKKLQTEVDAATAREAALNARTQELGVFQQQASNLTDQVAELQRQVDALTAANEQLDRDAKAARAEAGSATASASADVAKVQAAQQIADGLRTLLG